MLSVCIPAFNPTNSRRSSHFHSPSESYVHTNELNEIDEINQTNETNQTNQINEINQIDQINQINQINEKSYST
jgi:hypothetical protein